MPTRTVEQLDRDLTELRRKREDARRAGEDDYALVLTCALNRALEERHAAARDAGQAVAHQGTSVGAAG